MDRTPNRSRCSSTAIRAGAVVIVSVLAFAGCGSSSDDDAAKTTTTAGPAATVTTPSTPSTPTEPAPPMETTAPPMETTAPPPTSAPTTAAPDTSLPPTANGPGPALAPDEAEAKIRSLGDWEPVMTTYDPAAALSAVVAQAKGSGSAASPMQVFFFSYAHYLGTATSEPRFAFNIADTQADAITIDYAHYGPDDAFCCPSQGKYTVTFRLEGTKVVPDGPLPPVGQGLG